MDQSSPHRLTETINLLLNDFSLHSSSSRDSTASLPVYSSLPSFSLDISPIAMENPIDRYNRLEKYFDIVNMIHHRSSDPAPALNHTSENQCNHYQYLRQKQNEYWSKLKYDLANEQYQQHKHSAALKNLHDAIELDPDSIDAHYLRGLVYIEINGIQKAIKDFKKVLSLKNDHVEAASKLRSLTNLTEAKSSSSSSSQKAKLLIKDTLVPQKNGQVSSYPLVQANQVSYQQLIDKLSDSMQATTSSSSITSSRIKHSPSSRSTNTTNNYSDKHERSPSGSSDSSESKSREKRKLYSSMTDDYHDDSSDLKKQKKRHKEKRKHKKEKHKR